MPRKVSTAARGSGERRLASSGPGHARAIPTSARTADGVGNGSRSRLADSAASTGAGVAPCPRRRHAARVRRRFHRHPRRLGGAPFHYFDKGSMATISRFSAVADIGKFRFGGFIAWALWLVVPLMYIVGFKSRVTTVFHWLISFLGRGRSQRVATQQQVYGRLALEHVGPEFEQSKTGGLTDEEPVRGDLTGRRSA